MATGLLTAVWLSSLVVMGQMYDAYGTAAFDNAGGAGGAGGFGQQGPFGGFQGQGPFGGAYEFRWNAGGGPGQQEAAEELFRHFEDFFSPFGRRARPQTGRGVDLESSVRLSFMEAVRGCTKDVPVTFITMGDNGRPTRKTKTVTVDIPPGRWWFICGKR